MEWFLNNWGLILTAITTPIAWIFGGKQAKRTELKSANADFLEKVQTIYDKLVDDLKSDREELKVVNAEQDKIIKANSEDIRALQKQFNDLYMAYAKEVEASKYWKDKFEELESKYNKMEAEYEEIKTICDKLRTELDKYKKQK